jgi:hypothetical protein
MPAYGSGFIRLPERSGGNDASGVHEGVPCVML